MRKVEIDATDRLDDHAAVAHLAPAVAQLQAEVVRLRPRMKGRTVWMVNSTERGGGVAEMLPAMVTMMRDLGVPTEWVVLESGESEFFTLTKRLHNLIHGEGDPRLDAADRELYEAVNRRNADALLPWLRPGDIVVVHDPQPMALGSYVRENVDVLAFWRCHIGLDEENAATRAAWSFLEPYATAYTHTVFSAPEYIPRYLATHATVIYPAIDPLAPKNRPLRLRRVVEVLSNSELAVVPGPVVTPPFERVAQRLQPNGTFAPATHPEDIGLLSRPVLVQISRWDRLKGFLPLMRAFAAFKRRHGANAAAATDPLYARRLRLARLVLAGPDPGSIQDDPEAQEVLRELTADYAALDGAVKDDIALITLPMESPDENAVMVNVLQRCAAIVVQNSVREGFGLTVTEGMWKGAPVLSNRKACGPRHQVRDGLDGRLVDDPEDVDAVADMMAAMLAIPGLLQEWGDNAQRRAHDEFMIYKQLSSWGRLVSTFL